jgi:hypothetical protein
MLQNSGQPQVKPQQRQPMPPGAMPKKPMSPTGQAIEQNRSVFNPTDVASLVQSGQFTPQTTVTEFLGFFGIDPNGPVTQLIDFQKNQIDKADPLNKMKAIAGAGKAPAPTPQAQPPAAANRFPQGAKPAVEQGLGGLVTQMGG